MCKTYELNLGSDCKSHQVGVVRRVAGGLVLVVRNVLPALNAPQPRYPPPTVIISLKRKRIVGIKRFNTGIVIQTPTQYAYRVLRIRFVGRVGVDASARMVSLSRGHGLDRSDPSTHVDGSEIFTRPE